MVVFKELSLVRCSGLTVSFYIGRCGGQRTLNSFCFGQSLQLILTVSTLGRCGGLERTFLIVSALGRRGSLKELILNSFYFGQVCVALKELSF